MVLVWAGFWVGKIVGMGLRLGYLMLMVFLDCLGALIFLVLFLVILELLFCVADK